MTRRQQQKRLEWEMTAESIGKRFTTGTKRALNWMALTSELHSGATGGIHPLLCHEMVIIKNVSGSLAFSLARRCPTLFQFEPLAHRATTRKPFGGLRQSSASSCTTAIQSARLQ